MKLNYIDTIKCAINGFEANIFDKAAAIKMIEDAGRCKCSDCSNEIVKKSFSVIDFVIDDDVPYEIMPVDHPLDSMTVYEAKKIYKEKSVLLVCDGGHVVGIHKEPLNISNIMGGKYYGQGEERACV